MLTDNARQFYLDVLRQKNLSLEELLKATKYRFQTPEQTHALLRDWDSLSSTVIMSSIMDKSLSDCFEILLARLPDIQASLLDEYRNNKIVREKLLNSVRGVPDC